MLSTHTDREVAATDLTRSLQCVILKGFAVAAPSERNINNGG